jgi:hypothetical protein
VVFARGTRLLAAQRAVLALDIEKLVADEAKKRQVAMLKQNQSADPTPGQQAMLPVMTPVAAAPMPSQSSPLLKDFSNGSRNTNTAAAQAAAIAVC